MNRKVILLIIIIPILIIILSLFIFSIRNKYNNYVIDNNEWNDILNNRNSYNLNNINIEFNDYDLVIDEYNKKIYYSLVDTSNKYNPIVKINNYSIAFNSKINDENIDNKEIKMIVYDDNYYSIYDLIVTKYSILNINYRNEKITGKRIDVQINTFDNKKDIRNRVIKSDGKLMIINNDEYLLSLIHLSLGRNKRENDAPLFGMSRHNEFILKKVLGGNKDNYIRLFINNKYVGIYEINKYNERNNLRYEWQR